MTDRASEPTPASPSVPPASTSVSDHGYTLWAVFARAEGVVHSPDSDTEILVGKLDVLVASLQERGVTIRGFYDVSGLRAEGDIMVWLHAASPEALQAALRELRRSPLFSPLFAVWNAMGVHRDAEFSSSHLPSYMRGKPAESWLTVYPFVRSYEWYLLPEDERRGMLGQHGRQGSEYPQVLANTVASFALGDYEWILALEAPELVDLVDLMRHLRQTDARLHVREEVPFYTGRKISTHEIPEVLS